MAIGTAAFGDSGGTNKTTLTGVIALPSSITTIGTDAFRRCINVTSLTIPDSVTTIGNRAFARMYALPSVFIPKSVTSIGDYPFYFDAAMTAITVDSDNPNFSSLDGVLYNKDKTTLRQYPCGNTQATFTTPASVTSISIAAFAWCENLTSVTLTNNITSIGDAAFEYCSVLDSAYFYGNAPTMGTGVFYGCASGFTVYYLAGATGFTNPWYTYPTAEFTPPSTTTTTVASTTTTSVPPPTTTVLPTTTTISGPSCAGVVPASAARGATLYVTINGTNTSFEDGVTEASFCNGSNGILINSITVTSATVATANITIPADATVGACDVTVTTGAEIVTCTGAFTIGPTCGGVAPASAARGATRNVTITGVETNFDDGLTAVSFMCAGTTSYITVNGSPTVNSPTQTVANITIASNAPLGACDVIATTNLETITCTGAFTINAASTTTTTSGGGGGGGGGGNSTTTTTPAVTTTTVPATTTTVPATTTTTAAITTTTTTALTECQIKSIQPSGIKIGFGLLPRIRRVTLTLNTDLESLGITCADLNIQNAPRGIRIISCAVAGDTIEATILFWGIQPGTYNINLGQGQCGSIPFIVSRF